MNLLTSSEDEIQLQTVAKKAKSKVKRQKWLGEISLLSSDEEEITKLDNEDDVVDLLTSDEDDTCNVNKTLKTVQRKRNLDNAASTIPPKKTKRATVKANTGLKKPKQKQTPSKKKLASKGAQKSANENLNDLGEIAPAWEDFELLADQTSISLQVAKNLTKLFEDGVSIPFIARYRKNVTQNMSPDTLREVKETYEDICNLKDKISVVTKTIYRAGKFSEQIQRQIINVRTMEELEFISSPFKMESRDTKANKARKLGLEEPAYQLLNNMKSVNLMDYVDFTVDGLKTLGEVEAGVIDILSTEMVLDSSVLEFIREVRQKNVFYLEISEKQTKVKKKDNEEKTTEIKLDNKYDLYIGKEFRMDFLKPHQILAINRGESQKCLNVKVKFPEFFAKQFHNFCYKKWIGSSYCDALRRNILEKAIDQAYNKFFKSHVTRQIRSELTRKAHKASYEVFSINLKQLLLAPPLKGKMILGLDPGFRNGCKLALISPTGSVLAHNVIYINRKRLEAETILKEMLLKYDCDLIALGNGHGCREAEMWISDLIKNKTFGHLEVKYTIVSEDGASIYSCSPEATKEFPNMDPNIISAISLARRVQDPMAELVKVEPAHLGIGMYQHDLKKKELATALNDVVSECVSFVGVDLNTASKSLLRHVAGLTDKKANLIITYREKNGPFVSRDELLHVSTIGEKTFQQCSGFLHVGPTDSKDCNFYRNKKTTPLDRTIIHPESYDIARKIISKADLKELDIGSNDFIRRIKQKYSNADINSLSTELETSNETVQLIIDALSKNLNYDLRQEVGTTPLFKQEVTNFDSLSVGLTLTGRITNVTHFGAFVDIGVGSNGLIHVTKMNNLNLKIGDKVEVKILDVNRTKKHIALQALSRFD